MTMTYGDSCPNPFSAVPLQNVSIEDTFWQPRLETNRDVTLKIEEKQLAETGRLKAWKLNWKPGDPNKPHKFWDSDVAKWLEAVAYTLEKSPNKELETSADSVIDDIAAAQQPDGYLNSCFTVVAPEKRWTNLRDDHELYCAGHLMEAAVAYWRATGKRKFLDTLERYTEHIAARFGPEEGKIKGYPGHEEIELALVRLYRATGKQQYLNLAEFFIDQRGQEPNFFVQEAEARGEDPERTTAPCLAYWQAHVPVREQDTAEGHAVRAIYLYCGMADVAAETHDTTLFQACRRLFDNITKRRMYLTGGVGSAHKGERFTFDYDLPNESAYAETCAAIALVFFAHRMLQLEPHAAYADVMERALYNNVLAGVSLDGKTFFYVNPLAVYPPMAEYARYNKGKSDFQRNEWFGTSCCPPNIARILASLGSYIYSYDSDNIWVHLYISGTAEIPCDGENVTLTQDTEYPWQDQIGLTVNTTTHREIALNLRLPGWCNAPALQLNGEDVDLAEHTHNGYVTLKRQWTEGDRINLTLPMPPRKIEAHPEVRQNAGKIALQRGPLVYCLEEEDNGKRLHDIHLPDNADVQVVDAPELFGGIKTLQANAFIRDEADWENRLYRPVQDTFRAKPIHAIPYCFWANRTPGEMQVWINRMPRPTNEPT